MNYTISGTFNAVTHPPHPLDVDDQQIYSSARRCWHERLT
jgi:hypothetical protein